MSAHFPDKTIKQFRDKRQEATYKRLLQERTQEQDQPEGERAGLPSVTAPKGEAKLPATPEITRVKINEESATM
jgi:hypothetical protein